MDICVDPPALQYSTPLRTHHCVNPKLTRGVAKLSNQHPVTNAFGYATTTTTVAAAASGAVEWPEARSSSVGDNPVAISTRSAIDTDNPATTNRYATIALRELARLH
ncbi:hypothetical protein CBL_03400 [Carabus blaptoides fortunei]